MEDESKGHYAADIATFSTVLLSVSFLYQVFFRAGALGTLEEIRDDTLAKLMTFMQAWIRGYISRKSYRKLQEQRVALIVVQRNLRKFLKMRTWKWFNLWQKVKPLLNVTRIEDEIKALEEKAAKAEEELEKETKLRKDLESAMAKLQEEKNNLQATLDSTKGSVSDFLDKQAKLQSQKADLEAQLNVSIFSITGLSHEIT